MSGRRRSSPPPSARWSTPRFRRRRRGEPVRRRPNRAGSCCRSVRASDLFVSEKPVPHVSVSKVLLITGGGRGIGAATGRLAAERGYAVCVNYRQNQAAADEVVRSIEERGARAIAVAADVSL